MSLSRYTWTMSAHTGCYVFDFDAQITLYALWSDEKFDAFQEDLHQCKEEWKRRPGTRGVDRNQTCAIYAKMDDSFFPTRAMARRHKNETTTRYTVRNYRVVKLSVLLFNGVMFVVDAKKVR